MYLTTVYTISILFDELSKLEKLFTRKRKEQLLNKTNADIIQSIGWNMRKLSKSLQQEVVTPQAGNNLPVASDLSKLQEQ